MKLRGLAGGATLVVLLAAGQADAAWNNAFQVCCNGSRNSSSNYYVAPPVVAYSAPSGGCCTTSYVQRCYYQPVVSYKTVCEKVTSYRTSYFLEPVCSYRSSCYYDPCTGQSVQVTQPVTTYEVRSKCNAVTSYVQRCVPVVTQRQVMYLEAVQNCPPPCPAPCSSGLNINESAPIPDAPRIPPQYVPEPARKNSLQGPAVPAPAAPSLKPIPESQGFDRIASTTGAAVRGQVVAKNYVTPLRGAKILFVSRDSQEKQQTAQADAYGRFSVSLPAGGWNIFVGKSGERLDYHSSIDVQDAQNRQVTVVSR